MRGGQQQSIPRLKPQSAEVSGAAANAIALLGYLNGDGNASAGDAIKILRLVVGLQTDWPLAWQLAWVTGTVKEFMDSQTTPLLEGVLVIVPVVEAGYSFFQFFW